jgi:hypothetical protein
VAPGCVHVCDEGLISGALCGWPQARLQLQGAQRVELNAAETSVVGAAAGAVTALLTTPLDVVKTRLMTQGSSARYAGIADCVSKIARQEGLGTFFTVRWAPLAAPCPACMVCCWAARLPTHASACIALHWLFSMQHERRGMPMIALL